MMFQEKHIPVIDSVCLLYVDNCKTVLTTWHQVTLFHKIMLNIF